MRTTLTLVSLLAATLAGCSGGGGEGDIGVEGPDGGVYTFTARVDAENYTWDFGDYSGLAYGETVTHRYGFENGNVTVSLAARTGTATTQHTTRVVVGDGSNQVPTFIMDAPTNWTMPGEAVRFSGASSTDPDGDTLVYSWSCYRKSGVAVAKPHEPHGPVGGRDFATPPAGRVTVRPATGPLPSPDHVIEGDLCQGLAQMSRFSPGATVEGAFESPGLYSVTMLGSDGKMPSTSGSWDIYVGHRPPAVARVSMAGVLQAGANGTLQGAIDDSPLAGQLEGAYDMNQTSFMLTLSAHTTYVNLTYDAGAANLVTWELKRGTTVARGGADGAVLGFLKYDGPYYLIVRLVQGAQVNYSITLESHYILDPSVILEPTA